MTKTLVLCCTHGIALPGFYYSIYFIGHYGSDPSPPPKKKAWFSPYKKGKYPAMLFFNLAQLSYLERLSFGWIITFQGSDPVVPLYPLPPRMLQCHAANEVISCWWPRLRNTGNVHSPCYGDSNMQQNPAVRGVFFLAGWFCFFSWGPSPGVPKYCISWLIF